MHLPEGNAHLLKDVLLLDAGADQVGFYSLDKLLELEAGYVVVDQRPILHVVRGALVVVVVAELISGTDDLHAQIFIGADDVAWAEAADKEHHLLAFQAWAIFGNNGVA